MRSFLFIVIFALPVIGISQTMPKPRSTAVKGTARPPAKAPANTPVKSPVNTPAKLTIDKGKVVGRRYTNRQLAFEITFPDSWLIPDDDFEAFMKKQGFDLSLKAPDSLPVATKLQVNQAVKRVNVLLTAYRSMPGSAENAIVRISVEDLTSNPQIKDAVDYFDAIRAMYKTMKLPTDFTYSETDAEKLGDNQFAFLDTSTTAGKKRVYALVRNGAAIMFTISYQNYSDLQTLREALGTGNFDVK